MYKRQHCVHCWLQCAYLNVSLTPSNIYLKPGKNVFDDRPLLNLVFVMMLCFCYNFAVSIFKIVATSCKCKVAAGLCVDDFICYALCCLHEWQFAQHFWYCFSICLVATAVHGGGGGFFTLNYWMDTRCYYEYEIWWCQLVINLLKLFLDLFSNLLLIAV